MNICKTDYRLVCRFLESASKYIRNTSESTRMLNQARLMARLANKLKSNDNTD